MIYGAIKFVMCLSALSLYPIFPNQQIAFTESPACSLAVTPPVVRTISSGVREIQAGDQLVIAAQVSSCLNEMVPFVTIIEVRNSDGVTEYLGWQGGDLEGPDYAVEVGLSWIPTRAGSYELRTLAINDLESPLIFSAVMTAHVSIPQNDKAVIVIPYDPNPILQELTFEPSFIKVVLGVNNTVVWTNGDSVSHRLAPDPQSPNDFEFDYENAFLYSGYSTVVTFTEPGEFRYIDVDRGWMHGIIWVIPGDAVDAYLNLTINGLQDSYSLGRMDKVEFSLDMMGFETGCGSADIMVERINEDQPIPFTWSIGAVFDCGTVATEYRNISMHFPWPEIGTFYDVPIDKPGTYRLTASFNNDLTSANYKLEKEFVVTP